MHAQVFAAVSGGVPDNALLESLGNASMTAQMLGGCALAERAMARMPIRNDQLSV